MRDRGNCWRRAAALILVLCMLASIAGCSSQETAGKSSAAANAGQVLRDASEKAPPEELPPTDEKQGAKEGKPSGTDSWEEEEGLSDTQRNSVNMLNYLTVLAQQIGEGTGDQLLLESAYSSLVNDIYPNAVDMRTQEQITSLMDTIDSYRMISVKRDRIAYLYDQSLAMAMRQALPESTAIVKVGQLLQAGERLRAIASVVYIAVGFVATYEAAVSKADQEFLESGWELSDSESKELHNNTKNALLYMLDMVREYDLPGDYALGREDVENFVKWSGKPDSQLVSKITWFENHQDIYGQFGPYWLELARDYYNYDSGNTEHYKDCLEAVKQYEYVSSRIFRKDLDYAKVLPMAIISARETLSDGQYINAAVNYCGKILENTKDSDWVLRYFAAQTYLDLYRIKKEDVYLYNAYNIALNNVNILVNEQRELNAAYLADIQEIKPERNATKRQKEEAKNYNKLLKEERRIALPPVSEALYLNCDLLFDLAEIKDFSGGKKGRIDSILHVDKSRLFLSEPLDNRFWVNNPYEETDEDEIDVTFTGSKFTLPAVCVTDRSSVTVTVSGKGGKEVFDDWTVTGVKRPKKGGVGNFTATFESGAGKKYKFRDGETVTIKVIPVTETPEEYLEFVFDVVGKKRAFVISSISFERKTD